MFFPYNTDAPIYYFPIITIGMIIVNVLVFGYDISHPGELRDHCLAIGGGIHPVQWLTSCFMHADLGHLLGNMLALWSFGLVVEGKLGPWKSLPAFLGIGIAVNCIIQFLFLGCDPTCALGASAIVYGLMAISLIWAPENEINCLLLLYHRPFYFDVPVKIMVALFVGLDFTMLVYTQRLLSSEFAHTLGALVGFGIGIVLLKCGWVNCENWDVFSVWKGRHLMTDQERAKQDAARPEAAQKRAEKREKRLGMLQEGIELALKEGNPMPAFVINGKMKKESPEWILPESEMLLLIQLLLEKGNWDEAIETMREYLAHYTGKAALVRLNLANVLIEQKQPRSAMEVLARIKTEPLDAGQIQYFRRLQEKAAKMMQSF